MKNNAKLMKSITKLFLMTMMVFLIPMKHVGQTPYRQYADEGILLNFFEIDNHDFRLFLLYNLDQDDRFILQTEEESGLFNVVPGNEGSTEPFINLFEEAYNHALADFRLFDKVDLVDLVAQWKTCVPAVHFTSITLDLALSRAITINNHCVDSDPFCTSDVIQFVAANTSQTAEQLEGVDELEDGCIGSSYNPSWYHMRINTPGQFIIHMEGHDPDYGTNRDIDFCMWGPYTDPTSPCVAQLTEDKIIDCNYSSSYSEDIFLGFPEWEHQHEANHGTINYHVPETGEYYILMITNYSREPCVITFTKTEGSGPGTTDCGILPGIATNSGPYCVGETISLNVTTQNGATYSWTGPNGFSSTLQNPTIPNCTFEMGGTYTCVTTVDGQTTTGSTEVIVFAEPVANFEAPTVCFGETTQFNSTATTAPAGHEITGYHWDFGDGEESDEQNPTHAYAAAGTYQVTYTVQTGHRCEDEITQDVIVLAMPVPTATVSPSSVIHGGVATLTVDPGAEGNFTYHWEPANMVTNPNSQTTQTVPLTETVVFTCTVTNADGDCSSSVQATAVMAGSDLTATATADQYEICENESTTLHAIPVAGTGNYTYSWSPANTLSNPNVQNPTATPSVGETTYTCIVGDGITEQTVSVNIMVHPNAASDMYEAICQGDTYYFFGQVLNIQGDYHYTAQTIHGCDSIITLHLSINLNQESNFEVEDGHCDSYFWDPMDHEIISTDHEGLEYTESGTYHRTYKTIHGCDSVVTMSVRLDYTPVPTEIYPLDPENTAPHWVVTATEFQINSYDFQLWDTNPHCAWDTVTWTCDEAPSWVLEPFGEKGKKCKVFVLDHVNDTIWLKAHAFNHCAPEEGIEQKYWFVCSFYGTDDHLSQAHFDVVPNPNNGQMNLHLESLTGVVDIKVYDMRGMLIDSFQTYNANGNGIYTYTMKKQTAGIYYFVATCKEGTVTKKVVIQP